MTAGGTMATCIGCGCDDHHACQEGCWWVRVDYGSGVGVCSSCEDMVGRWDKGSREIDLPRIHFLNLVATLAADNWIPVAADPEQLRIGTDAVGRMIADGAQFPPTAASIRSALNDIDSIYWRLAAGEETERLNEFRKMDGFAELDVVLNEIFGEEAQ